MSGQTKAPHASAELVARIGLKKAMPPEPKRYAQCRNCKSFVYDDSERLGLSGKLLFIKQNTRCNTHHVAVQLGMVCDDHAFAYADRSDR